MFLFMNQTISKEKRMPTVFSKAYTEIPVSQLSFYILWCCSVHINLCCGMKDLQHFLFCLF